MGAGDVALEDSYKCGNMCSPCLGWGLEPKLKKFKRAQKPWPRKRRTPVASGDRYLKLSSARNKLANEVTRQGLPCEPYNIATDADLRLIADDIGLLPGIIGPEYSAAFQQILADHLDEGGEESLDDLMQVDDVNEPAFDEGEEEEPAFDEGEVVLESW